MLFEQDSLRIPCLCVGFYLWEVYVANEISYSNSFIWELTKISGIDSYAQVYSRNGHPYTITASSENFGTINPFKRRNNEQGVPLLNSTC